MKKALALILSLAMIVSVCMFAACGEEAVDTTTAATTTAATTTEATTTAATTTEATTTEGNQPDNTTTEGNQPDNTTTEGNQPEQTTDEGDDPVTGLDGFDGTTKLPGYEDIDFGGRTFVICGQIETEDVMGTDQEIYSEETDAVHTAVRLRNKLVESLYNCKIAWQFVEAPGAVASADISGNQHTIDIFTKMYTAPGDYTGNNMFNLYNLGIDFTNPWWDQNFVESFTFNMNGQDAMYSAIGDFSLTTNDSTFCLFYNKSVYESSEACNTYDIYQLVRDKKWTMDVMIEMIKGTRKDSNGDQSWDYTTDLMGWVHQGHGAHALYAASNLRIVANVDGKLMFQPSSEAETWSTVINKAAELYALEGCANSGYTQMPATMAEGRTLFASEILTFAERCKDYTELRLGLIPYPLYSETQSNYANYVDNHRCEYMIPISVPDPETVATFFELYTCHSKYTVREAYIETMKVEYFADEDSGEMLDMILDNRSYDPGYLWFSSYESDLQNMITTGKNNVTNWAAAKGKRLQQDLDTFHTNLNDNTN